MASAKQSSLDRLYKLFVTELTDQLKGSTDPETGERTPAQRSLIGCHQPGPLPRRREGHE
jgi:hypothetical protein